MLCKGILRENYKWAKEVFEKLENKMSVITTRSRNKLPDGVDENGIHIDKYLTQKHWWTNGFWGATNLLLYNYTRKQDYLLTAKKSEELIDEDLKDYEKLDHDVGFMWHILSGSDYRITGDKKCRNTNLWVAASLFSRFVMTENGGFIRAWNNDKKADWSIIDCMMNLSLLYWASEELRDDRFKRIAMTHADMAIRDHIRGDGSVVHIVEHDRRTGKCIRTYGGQGYREGSSWSRGCAWALYGFVISYNHTHEKRYLDAAMKVAEHFIGGCEQNDWLPPVDFFAPKEPRYYDSSAGSIASCGLMELAKCLGEDEGAKYLESAVRILKTMTDKFCDFNQENDHILGYGTVMYPTDGDLKKAGVHVSIIYGDYFYTEAILKLLGEEYIPW